MRRIIPSPEKSAVHQYGNEKAISITNGGQ
jgi:hypothetical protein